MYFKKEQKIIKFKKIINHYKKTMRTKHSVIQYFKIIKKNLVYTDKIW